MHSAWLGTPTASKTKGDIHAHHTPLSKCPLETLILNLAKHRAVYMSKSDLSVCTLCACVTVAHQLLYGLLLATAALAVA